MRLVRLIWMLLGLVMCACSRAEVEVEPFPLADITIAELRGLAESGVREIEREMTIVGRIVSSDSTRNLYRRVVVDDGTAGAELLTGFYDNYLWLPEGAKLAVQLRGLAVAVDGGVVCIGLPNGVSDAEPQPFGTMSLWWQKVTMAEDVERVLPVEFDPGDDFSHLLGRRVRVDGVSLASVERTMWSGVHLFCDAEGDSLWVSTTIYATFACNTIPFRQLSLQGILYRRNARPCLTVLTQ